MAIVDSLSLAYQTARALASVLDTLGRGLPLSPDQAARVRSTVYLVSAILAPRITTGADVGTIGQTLAAAAAAIAGDVTPRDGAPAFATAAAAAAIAAPVSSSPALTRFGTFARMLAGCLEAAFLGQGFVLEAKTDFADRQSAIAARTRIAAAMDGAIDRIAANTGLAVVELLTTVANTASGHIATIATDLKPIVRVNTLRSAPSTALAYELYGDPSRADDLVVRNSCGTPLFMPVAIDALAPDS